MKYILIIIFSLTSHASLFIDAYLDEGIEGVLKRCATLEKLDNAYDIWALHGLIHGEDFDLSQAHRLLDPHQEILELQNAVPALKRIKDLNKMVRKRKKISLQEFTMETSTAKTTSKSFPLASMIEYARWILLQKMLSHREYESFCRDSSSAIFHEAVAYPLLMHHPRYASSYEGWLEEYDPPHKDLYKIEKRLWRDALSKGENFLRVSPLWRKYLEEESKKQRTEEDEKKESIRALQETSHKHMKNPCQYGGCQCCGKKKGLKYATSDPIFRGNLVRKRLNAFAIFYPQQFTADKIPAAFLTHFVLSHFQQDPGKKAFAKACFYAHRPNVVEELEEDELQWPRLLDLLNTGYDTCDPEIADEYGTHFMREVLGKVYGNKGKLKDYAFFLTQMGQGLSEKKFKEAPRLFYQEGLKRGSRLSGSNLLHLCQKEGLFKNALTFCKELADKGHPAAQTLMGDIYQGEFNNGPTQTALAIPYYEQGFSRINWREGWYVAFLYKKEGNLRDYVRILQAAAEDGSFPAQYVLSNAYFSGLSDGEGNIILEQNGEKGALYQEKFNSSKTLYDIYKEANLRYNKKDFFTLIELASQVIAEEDILSTFNARVFAQNLLGVCHYHGSGTPKDYGRAFSCFQQASEICTRYDAAHDEAFRVIWRNVALCHENGQGTPQDIRKARDILRNLSKRGDEDAKKKLILLLNKYRSSKSTGKEAFDQADALSENPLPLNQNFLLIEMPSQKLAASDQGVFHDFSEEEDISEDNASEEGALQESCSEKGLPAPAAAAATAASAGSMLVRRTSEESDPAAEIEEALKKLERQYEQDKETKMHLVLRRPPVKEEKEPQAQGEIFEQGPSYTLKRASKRTIEFLQDFYHPVAARALKREDLPSHFQGLGCIMKRTKSGVHIVFPLNSASYVSLSYHDEHKTTRSILATGGLRKEIKIFLAEIGASEEALKEHLKKSS